MTRVKICGLSRPADIAAVNAALPDYIGFVFAPSKRQVTPQQAARLRTGLDDRIQVVGVFVDADPQEVEALATTGVIDIAQLHGASPDAVAAVAVTLRANSALPLIVAQPVVGEISSSASPADYLLYDYASPGSGKTFDWQLLAGRAGNKPFFLAGGINLENIDAALALQPPAFCIDISSGAETDGKKDAEKIAALVGRVRAWGDAAPSGPNERSLA
ncbi:MAG: phosphoribosylanthranilate isomerase [Coriobacteriales bacterium]|jgi:phosphoribosylanthranilate isomerase|nr:phosphoribosylanthranilate isomerase [Coriobacteriales bacterium]